MRSTRPSSKVLLVGLILFVALFVFFLYTFLHESGHAFMGFLFGQSLTEFDISFWDLSAHVGLVGGRLTETQFAVQAAAGVFLPLLIWSLFISLTPRKANFTLEILKLFSSMAVVNTLLPWIVLPILFLLGKAPSDDVTNVLIHSQMPPLLLTVISLVLYAGSWALFLSRIDGLRNRFLLLGTTSHEKFGAGDRTTISVMAAIMAVCAIFVFILDGFAGKNTANKFLPPQNFEPVAQVDLSTQNYTSEVLKQFTLDEPAYVGIFLSIRNINTTYFDLQVTGSNNFHSAILHGEGYNAAQDGGLWQMNLPAGTYQIILNSHQSPGTASVFMKIY